MAANGKMIRVSNGPVVPMRDAMKQNFLDAVRKCTGESGRVNMLLVARSLKISKSSVQRWLKRIK